MSGLVWAQLNWRFIQIGGSFIIKLVVIWTLTKNCLPFANNSRFFLATRTQTQQKQKVLCLAEVLILSFDLEDRFIYYFEHKTLIDKNFN